jgi:hypothetical protein
MRSATLDSPEVGLPCPCHRFPGLLLSIPCFQGKMSSQKAPNGRKRVHPIVPQITHDKVHYQELPAAPQNKWQLRHLSPPIVSINAGEKIITRRVEDHATTAAAAAMRSADSLSGGIWSDELLVEAGA